MQLQADVLVGDATERESHGERGAKRRGDSVSPRKRNMISLSFLRCSEEEDSETHGSRCGPLDALCDVIKLLMLSVTCTASPSRPRCAAADARPRPQLGGDVDQGAPLLLLHSEVCSRRFCTRGIIGVKVQLPETDRR